MKLKRFLQLQVTELIIHVCFVFSNFLQWFICFDTFFDLSLPGSEDFTHCRVQTIHYLCKDSHPWYSEKTTRLLILPQLGDHGKQPFQLCSHHFKKPWMQFNPCAADSPPFPPRAVVGRGPPGNEAVSRTNGRVLRPLGGLRLGEGGPGQCLSWAPAGVGEGARGASVGACVLGEALNSAQLGQAFGPKSADPSNCRKPSTCWEWSSVYCRTNRSKSQYQQYATT